MPNRLILLSCYLLNFLLPYYLSYYSCLIISADALILLLASFLFVVLLRIVVLYCTVLL